MSQQQLLVDASRSLRQRDCRSVVAVRPPIREHLIWGVTTCGRVFGSVETSVTPGLASRRIERRARVPRSRLRR